MSTTTNDTNPDAEAPEKPADEAVEPTEQGSQEPADTNEEDTPTEPQDGSDEGQSDDEGDKELSTEDLKSALEKVRREAAGWRTKFRELEKRLEGTFTAEEVEELKNKVKAESAEEVHRLLVEAAALRHGLPDELAELLKGETREEIDAHAKKLAPFGQQPKKRAVSDASGGLDPSTGSGDYIDPVKAARDAVNQLRS